MLMGKTALIVGFGRVGKALARRLIALGMRVEAIRRTPNKEIEREIGLARAGNTDQLIEFASHADFVVSAASVYPETRGLFNRDLFAAMKPDAFVVNISRGPVVNERDLVEALREKRIAGAGLDVFETEPPDPDNPLFQFPNVFRTPHVAGATSQNYDGIAQVVVHNLELVRSGKFPLHCVNATQLGSKLGKFPLS
jgi:phosphogluconate 2-dehydrogenase